MSNRSGSVASALVTLGTYLNALSQWYLIWLFARAAGAEAAGAYASIFAYATPLFVISHFGLRDHFLTSKKRFAWSAYLWIRLLGILVGVFGMGLLVWLADFPLAMAAAVTGMKVSNALLDLYNGSLQRAKNFMALGVISLMNAVATILASTASVEWLGSVVGAVWGSALVSLFCSLAAFRQSRTSSSMITHQILTGDMRHIARGAVPITIAQVASALTASLPVIVVERMGTTGEVGVFSGAAYLITFANLTGAAVRLIALPHLADTYDTFGRQQLHRHVLRLTAISSGIGLVVAFVAFQFGSNLLRLIYGPEFSMESSAILVLAISAAMVIPEFLLTAELLVLNAYRSQSSIGLASVLAAGMFAVVAVLFTSIPPIEAGCYTALVGKSVKILLTGMALRTRTDD